MHATTAALLAQARSAQGRYDDAAALTETVARDAAPEDVVTQALWRSVRAGVLARRGATEEAEALAREAVAILAATDALTDRGDAQLALAEILELSGRRVEAAAAAGEALELCAASKGAVVPADRARSAVRRSEPQVDGGDHAEVPVR